VSIIKQSPTPLNGTDCNALLLAHSSAVRQKLNHVSSVQLRPIVLYEPLVESTWPGNY